MRILPPPITPETFEKRISFWLKTLAAGESVSVIFCPRLDRHRRLNQLLGDKEILKKYLPDSDKYHFINLDFDCFPPGDVGDLKEFITHELAETDFVSVVRKLKVERRQLVLILRDAERLFEPQYRLIVRAIGNLIRNNSQIVTWSFFEGNLFLPKNLALFKFRTVLLENTSYWPLYQEPDIRQFLHYLEVKWNLKLPQKVADRIIHYCGGHLLFTKEAVRYYRLHSRASVEQIFDHEEMRHWLAWVVAGFSGDEQEVLRSVSRGTKISPQLENSLWHLKKLDLIRDNSLTLPILADYLNKQTKPLLLEVREGGIYYCQLPLRGVLSRQEYRVMKLLIENEAQVVSRERLAQAIWQEKMAENYSDWAIDQLMKRLRTRFSELGISPKLIKTVRGQGYRLGGKDVA